MDITFYKTVQLPLGSVLADAVAAVKKHNPLAERIACCGTPVNGPACNLPPLVSDRETIARAVYAGGR
jgi:hypothetical protein